MKISRLKWSLAIAMVLIANLQSLEANSTWADYLTKAAPYGQKVFSIGQSLWEKREIFYALGLGFLGYREFKRKNQETTINKKVNSLEKRVGELEVAEDANNLAKIRFDEELRKAKSIISDLIKEKEYFSTLLRNHDTQLLSITNNGLALAKTTGKLIKKVYSNTTQISRNASNIYSIKHKQEKEAKVISQLEKDNAMHKKTIASIFHRINPNIRPHEEISPDQAKSYDLKSEVLTKTNDQAGSYAKTIKIVNGDAICQRKNPASPATNYQATAGIRTIFG